jgi:hypothetical protein
MESEEPRELRRQRRVGCVGDRRRALALDQHPERLPQQLERLDGAGDEDPEDIPSW